jgi:hypothetical protein
LNCKLLAWHTKPEVFSNLGKTNIIKKIQKWQHSFLLEYLWHNTFQSLLLYKLINYYRKKHLIFLPISLYVINWCLQHRILIFNFFIIKLDTLGTFISQFIFSFTKLRIRRSIFHLNSVFRSRRPSPWCPAGTSRLERDSDIRGRTDPSSTRLRKQSSKCSRKL